SEVSRSIEALAGTFSIPVSLIPGNAPAIARGESVQVKIGGKVLIDGFVLSAEPFYSKDDCGMRIVGRDRAGDLIRSSAVHLGGQWRNARVDAIVKDLVRPFGLEVFVDTELGAPLQDFKIAHGERVLDTMARAARLRGVLVTTTTDADEFGGRPAGQIWLTRAGKKKFKGEIRRGMNVISMEGIGTDENRHSSYTAYGQSNTVADFERARGLKAKAVDGEIKRYCPLVINADGNTTEGEIQALVDHTLRVRRGHAFGFRYTVEGWTYGGEPWPLNQRVPIYDDIAGLDGAEWLICDVRQHCTLREGDVTDLTVRPVEAYDTAPLKTKVKRRNFGNKGNTTNHTRGPSDGAQGGVR
ncbi:MAG: hypothetical protein V4772_03745, partial [Pseudomonadota bacterium]